MENYGHGHAVKYKSYIEKDMWFELSSFTDEGEG